MMAGASDQARAARGTRNLIVITLVLFVASVLYTSSGVFINNHAVQVPLVKLLNDPTLYPGDPFAEALARYPSALWHAVAPLTRLVPLGPLLLVLFLLERLLMLYAASRLARAFAPGSTLAAVGAMALFAFAIHPLLGSGGIVKPYFEQTGVAIAFLLLAMAAFHEYRPVAWAVWTALAFNATIQYGAFALSYFGVVFLLDREYRRQWSRWIQAFGVFVLVASYALLLAFRALDHPFVDSRLWLAASYARGWRHLYPMTWPRARFLEAGALFALLALWLALDGGVSRKLRRHVLLWSGVAASWLVLAFVAAYVVVSPSILLTQPARATDLWICFAAVAIAAIGASKVESLWGLDVVRGKPLAPPRPGSSAPVSAGTVSTRPATGAWRSRLVVVGFVGSFFLWRPLGWLVAATCLIALAAPPVWRVIFACGHARRLSRLLVFWVCLSALWAFQRRVEDSGFLDALVLRPDPAVREVAAWAKASTPKEAVFLVELRWDSDWPQFRGLSERAIFTNWADGAAINWSPGFVTEWARRLRLLGFDVRSAGLKNERVLDDVYAALLDDSVERARTQIPFRYWVVPEDHPSGYPVVFASGGSKVLDLEGESVLP